MATKKSRERSLLKSALAGSREAAEALVERTYGQTYGALLRLCGDGDLAADLTQETYRRAWTGLSGFRGGCRFSTWLYRIAYTTFLNHVRRPRPMVSTEDECSPREIVDEAPGPEDVAHLQWESRRLRRAVMDLPETLRFTVTAHFWAEMPVKEVARQEGITTVAVRKRLKKALSLLALALEEEKS